MLDPYQRCPECGDDRWPETASRPRADCPRCGRPVTPPTTEEVFGEPREDEVEALDPILAGVYAAHGDIGTDQSGRPLVAEQVALLEKLEVPPEHRELVVKLWEAITYAKAEQRDLLDEVRRENARQKQKGHGR